MDRVLVVEDTDSLREVLAAVLRNVGYEVAACACAEEALGLLDKDEFQVILSDLKLPGKNGLDLVSETRRKHITTPFIVMTAYGNIDVAVDAMKRGATDFITKPFDPGSLCELIS